MNFHESLRSKIHFYIKQVYNKTKYFPRDELYGVVSQLRRSSMSVMLNYVEGFARRKSDTCKVYRNFLEISYGSLKESKYLLYFSYTEGYINEADYVKLVALNDEIGKMLWKTFK